MAPAICAVVLMAATPDLTPLEQADRSMYNLEIATR